MTPREFESLCRRRNEEVRMEAAQTSAILALTCCVLNNFTTKKDWRPTDFLPSVKPRQRSGGGDWRAEKEMLMAAFPPPEGYAKRYTHLKSQSE